MASGNVEVTINAVDIEGVRAALMEGRAAVELLRQFVDQGNEQYVPDEDMESLMAEAETFLEHGVEHLPDSLDAAWAEAEAALPEGWAIDGLYRVVARTSLEREWEVIVHEDDWQGDEDNHHGRGPTPAAALRALAAKLREREG